MTGAEYAEMKAVLYQNREIELQPGLQTVRDLVFHTWYYFKYCSGSPPIGLAMLTDLVEVDDSICQYGTPTVVEEDDDSSLPFSTATSVE
jgi:hypothetical protein